jgi:hypothetical protein
MDFSNFGVILFQTKAFSNQQEISFSIAQMPFYEVILSGLGTTSPPNYHLLEQIVGSTRRAIRSCTWLMAWVDNFLFS